MKCGTGSKNFLARIPLLVSNTLCASDESFVINAFAFGKIFPDFYFSSYILLYHYSESLMTFLFLFIPVLNFIKQKFLFP